MEVKIVLETGLQEIWQVEEQYRCRPFIRLEIYGAVRPLIVEGGLEEVEAVLRKFRTFLEEPDPTLLFLSQGTRRLYFSQQTAQEIVPLLEEVVERLDADAVGITEGDSWDLGGSRD